MKKILFVYFILFSLLYSSNMQCVGFIDWIGFYQNRVAEKRLRIKGLESTERFIIEYEKMSQEKKLIGELTNYLNTLSSMQESYINVSSFCINLQKVNYAKTKSEIDIIKNKFYGEIITQFNQAYEKHTKSYKFIDINAKSCDGYGNHATSLIAQYAKSQSLEYHGWIDKAIKIFEECKQEEYTLLNKSQNY